MIHILVGLTNHPNAHYLKETKVNYNCVKRDNKLNFRCNFGQLLFNFKLMTRDVTDPDRIPTKNSRTDHFLSIYEWSEHGTFLLS